MKPKNRETRSIPACCTSAACGRLECDGCPNLPKLESFQLWVRSTRARLLVCPNLYIATREPEPEGGKS